MTSDIEQQTRDKFEEWVKTQYQSPLFNRFESLPEEYALESRQMQWEAWQAALRTHNIDREGYVLVPKKPSRKMLHEAIKATGANPDCFSIEDKAKASGYIAKVYKSMIISIGEENEK